MPSAEAEHYIKQAGEVENKANQRGRLLKTATRYLRYNERQKRQDEAKRIREQLTPANVTNAKLGPESIAQSQKHLNILEEDLETNSPPTDLSGETRDQIWKEAQRLEEEIKQGMVPHEEMRRNPVGAVDRHVKWERANKNKILTWKNYQLLLNPNSEDQDLCNIEKLRPHVILPNGGSSYMPNAQIPGVFAQTPQAKANWPEGLNEYAENSPLMQAMRAELEELRQFRDEIKKQNDMKAQEKQAEAERKAEIKKRRQEHIIKVRAARIAKLENPQE